MNLSLTPERLRALRRYGGLSLVGVVVYLIAVYLSFPYGRLKELAIATAARTSSGWVTSAAW